MKVNKIFSIDHELVHKLKDLPNQSEVINRLIHSHFQGSTTLKQTQTLINTKEQLIKDTKKELKQLQPKLTKLIEESKKPKIFYS